MVGINTLPSLKLAKEAIYDYYLNHQDEKFQLLVHGGIWDAERIAKCIALGASGVGIGTGFLLCMGLNAGTRLLYKYVSCRINRFI